MVRQDQEQGLRWRNLTLPFLLPAVAMLLLFYLLSPDVAAESDSPPLEMGRSREENRALAHTSNAIIRQAVQSGDFWGAGRMVKGKGDAGSHANSLNPLCGTCKLSMGDASPQTVPPGGSARYELRVENTGDCDGTLTLTPTSQRGWGTDVTTPSLPASLQPGDWVTVTLVHTVPACEPSGTVDVVTVTATLDCTSCGNSDEKVTTLTTTVKRAYGVDLSPNISKTAVASETVLFTHTLSNTGNYTDDFGFDATSTLGSSIVLPPTTPVGLFSSTIIPVTVVVSPSAKRGQVDTIVVTATSMSDPNTSDPVIDRIEVMTSGCEVELNISEPVQRVTPGETVTYTLTVSNVGTHTGTAGIETEAPEDWSINITPPPTNTLPRGRSADWLVSLSVPLCKPPADKTTGITVVLTCTAIGTAADPENVTTTIVSSTAAAIEPGVIKIIPPTETDVIFTHTVTNTGNLTDTFDFPVHSAQGWPVTGPDSDEWGTCASKPITFSVSIPPDVPIISDTIVITAVPRHAPNQDTATDGIRADCDIRLNVDESVRRVIPGGSVTYTLTVSNVGTYTGSVSMEIDAPQDWSIVVTSPATTTLPSYQSVEWLVNLIVPPCDFPSEKTIGLTAVLTCPLIGKTIAYSKDVTATVVSTSVAAIELGVVKTIPVTEDIISDGTMVTFTHIVTNIGYLTDIFDFPVHSAQGWQVIGPASEELGTCESMSVTFTVTIPSYTQTVSDTLIITAVPRLAPDNCATATDGIEDGRVFLPIVMKNFCEGMSLCNGDFEMGNLSCWNHSHYGVPNELPAQTGPGLSGCCSALLGDPYSFGCRGGVPIGRAWMEQTFRVPSYGNPTITFTYEMHTQHTIDYDTFEAYLNGYRILKVGHTGPKSGCNGKPITITGMCTITLTNPTTDCNGNLINADFPCTDSTLRFENWNRSHMWYNTWTYVDDIEFTW